MPRLVPAEYHFIPVSAVTEGHDVQRLAIEKHIFPALKPARQRIAFLWSHSNGFHKESLHPVMRRFLSNLRSKSGLDDVDVHFIAWDARNHGDSARLNEGTFKETYTWFDNAMDTKQVIDQMRLKSDYNVLIGIGHSFGATSVLLCEFFYPRTFDAMCLIEPVIGPNIDALKNVAQYPIMASRNRRDEWPSREECLQSLVKRPFWKRFDPEVLKLYVDYGMYETPNGTIKLKCPKEQEFRNFFLQSYPRATGFASLETVSVPCHFIYALESDFLDPSDAHLVTGRNEKRFTIDFIQGGHMVPNERPDLVANHIIKIVDRLFGEIFPSKL
ncbi:hypothetical protein VTP01DRAFT_10250 [Rhizomucor pusillus]|uniref:uncharacterized protein n=1 Tax=Rhizomucor pusillus TaxID=4840 RepID=UPI0037428413